VLNWTPTLVKLNLMAMVHDCMSGFIDSLAFFSYLCKKLKKPPVFPGVRKSLCYAFVVPLSTFDPLAQLSLATLVTVPIFKVIKAF